MINISFQKENLKKMFENAKLFEAAKVFVKLVEEPSLLNIDQDDLLRLIEKSDGKIMLVTGRAEGRKGTVEAVHQALKGLENTDLSKASGIIIAFTGGQRMSLSDVNLAAKEVCRNMKDDADVVFGASVEPELKDAAEVYLMVFGTKNTSQKCFSTSP